MTSSKQSKIDDIKRRMIAEGVNLDLAASATQLIMGDGNLDAKIVFIGEAPGKKEDETGKPFVGASGKFLNEMLESIGLDREDVYITNIIKYRPPNNRDPKPAEKQEAWPYLLEQLDVIQPKAIVTLGHHSMEYFLPGVAISDVHGREQQVKVDDRSFTLIPLFHPAYALYNGKVREVLKEDFGAVARYMS